MLRNFHLKIVHHVGAKHSNVDALNKNLVGRYEVDENFGSEIQDLSGTSQEIPKSNVAKKAETIINLFTIMEVDVGNCSEEVTKKGKKLVFAKVKDKGNKRLTNKGNKRLTNEN